ncbi:MAG: CCA tRNA nucleotidyltransferase [Brevinema sp.]
MPIFPGDISKDILWISQLLDKEGFELYLVGGAVRDTLMNRPCGDFDLASSACPDDIIRIFNKLVPVIPTGIRHGTVTLIINNSQYEITTYRIDGTYTDQRHPDSVSFTSSLKEDLARRDFTVNSIAAHPITKELTDPFFGQDDIRNKVIRTVGIPDERFAEDALRMLRACRFAAVLGFTIEEETFEALCRLAPTIDSVSAERVRDELMKTLSAPVPSIGLEYMRKSGLLERILPELCEGIGIDQNEFHRYDVYTHNLKTCDSLTKGEAITRWASLLHDVGKPRAKSFALKIGNGNVFYNHEVIGAKMARGIMRRLKFSNDEIDRAFLLIELHMFFYTSEWTDGAVRRFLKRFDGDLLFLEQLFLLREADRLGSGTKKQAPYIFKEFRARIKQVMDEDSALKVTDLKINGTELIREFQLKPSPIIGEILHYLLELVLDDPSLNNNESLIDQARLYLIKHPDFSKE